MRIVPPLMSATKRRSGISPGSLENVPVLCGIAILEDQHHQTSEINVLRPDVIVSKEQALLERARSLMPRLPLDEIDLLIVDQIGKEISGTGMDTNIIGREITGYSTSFQQSRMELNRTSRASLSAI